MNEFVPLVSGLILGAVLMMVPTGLRRWLIPPTCIALGALSSAVNGELSHSAWALFVSFDALLVWASAVVAMTVTWSWQRFRSAAP